MGVEAMKDEELIKRKEPRSGGALFVQGMVRLAFGLVVISLVFYVTSGRYDWVGAWAFLGMLTLMFIINMSVLIPVNPEVIEERMHGGAKGVKRWDLVINAIMGVLWIGALIVAGLDARFGWSPPVEVSFLMAALGLFLLGDLLFLCAMAVNKFFAKLVRIQTERGHRVVSGGPYLYVRHPGYVGWIMISAATPLILGSLWAFLPVGLATVFMLLRTALEDRALRQELAGYDEYAGRVRYRLLPGVW
jgi:protein-S-isoprenylcysteine O-methyltransferase Ste14